MKIRKKNSKWWKVDKLYVRRVQFQPNIWFKAFHFIQRISSQSTMRNETLFSLIFFSILFPFFACTSSPFLLLHLLLVCVIKWNSTTRVEVTKRAAKSTNKKLGEIFVRKRKKVNSIVFKYEADAQSVACEFLLYRCWWYCFCCWCSIPLIFLPVFLFFSLSFFFLQVRPKAQFSYHKARLVKTMLA